MTLRALFLAVLLGLACLALPSASAAPPGSGDLGDIVAVEGADPDLPAQDLVRVRYRGDGGGGSGVDVGLEAFGTLLLVTTSCTPASVQCHVCYSSDGEGPYPVALGERSEGTGVGVDLSPLGGPLPFPVRLAPKGEPGEEQDASSEAAEGGGYGPYTGAFVSLEGHCAA